MRPVSGQLCGPMVEIHRVARFPAAFRPPAFASWAILFPPRTLSVPHGRPTGAHTRPGLDGVATFRMRKTRSGWVPPIPRSGGAPATGWVTPVAACRFPAASSTPQYSNPSTGLTLTRLEEVHSRSPVRSSPHLCPPDGTAILGLEPGAPHPAVTSDARPSGDRHRAPTWGYVPIIIGLHSNEPTSHMRPRVAPPGRCPLGLVDQSVKNFDLSSLEGIIAFNAPR